MLPGFIMNKLKKESTRKLAPAGVHNMMPPAAKEFRYVGVHVKSHLRQNIVGILPPAAMELQTATFGV